MFIKSSQKITKHHFTCRLIIAMLFMISLLTVAAASNKKPDQQSTSTTSLQQTQVSQQKSTTPKTTQNNSQQNVSDSIYKYDSNDYSDQDVKVDAPKPSEKQTSTDSEEKTGAADNVSKSESKKDKDHDDYHDHSIHAAHTHYVGELNIALNDKNDIAVEIHVPLDTLVGFEHKAKTKKELKLMEQIKKKFVVDKLLSFHKSLQCKLLDSTTRFNYKDGHSEGQIIAKYTCPMLKSKDKKIKKYVKILLHSKFSRVKKVNLTFVPPSGIAKKSIHDKKDFKVQLQMK